MPKSDKDLIAVREGSFNIHGSKLQYVVLENNAVLIVQKGLLNTLNITVNDLADFNPTVFWNAKKKSNHGFYLKVIPEILIFIITKSSNEKTIIKVKELLHEISFIALKSLTGEKDIVEDEPKKEPSFDQLLGALMKVPPPKK